MEKNRNFVILITLFLLLGNGVFSQNNGFWRSQSGNYFQLDVTRTGFRYHNAAFCPTAKTINQIIVDDFGYNANYQKLFQAGFVDNYGNMTTSIIFTVIDNTAIRLDVTYYDAYRRVAGTDAFFWTYHGNRRPLSLPHSCGIM